MVISCNYFKGIDAFKDEIPSDSLNESLDNRLFFIPENLKTYLTNDETDIVKALTLHSNQIDNGFTEWFQGFR